tara:strand:+ start:81 stop:383 length:303 start_codon:yes stop_codon:yes gene_type:complete
LQPPFFFSGLAALLILNPLFAGGSGAYAYFLFFSSSILIYIILSEMFSNASWQPYPVLADVSMYFKLYSYAIYSPYSLVINLPSISTLLATNTFYVPILQ